MTFPSPSLTGTQRPNDEAKNQNSSREGERPLGSTAQLRQQDTLRERDPRIGGITKRIDDMAQSLSPSSTSAQPTKRTASFATTASMDSVPERGSFRSNTLSRSSSRPTTSHPNSFDMDAHHEPDLWHSVPLLFAVVPAIGGIVFKKGSIILTDFALLVLAGIYLNWCLVTPWRWYNQARRIQMIKPSLTGHVSEEALAEDLNEDRPAEVDQYNSAGDGERAANGTIGDNGAPWPRRDGARGNQGTDLDVSHPEEMVPNAGQSPGATKTVVDAGPDPIAAADNELAHHETLALALTIIGPLLGAFLLHNIRSALTASTFHADELVTNMHLTLFVLGAELRPIRHCMTLIHNRTLHLQRVVREDPHASTPSTVETALETAHGLTDLQSRVDELERAAADAKSRPTPAVPQPQSDPNAASTAAQDTLRKSSSQLQTQIDALNRAVRRYEKRATAQTLQTDSRLRDLEARMQDALTLAAVAARDTQKPGFVWRTVSWSGTLIAAPLSVAKAALTLPLRAAEWGMAEVLGVVGGYKESSRSTRRLTNGVGDGRTAAGKIPSKATGKEADRYPAVGARSRLR